MSNSRAICGWFSEVCARVFAVKKTAQQTKARRSIRRSIVSPGRSIEGLHGRRSAGGLIRTERGHQVLNVKSFLAHAQIVVHQRKRDGCYRRDQNLRDEGAQMLQKKHSKG